jgi:hypothetical protein
MTREVVLTLPYAEATQAGDYYQVSFEAKAGQESSSYALLQAQSEFPDDGQSYFEVDGHLELCGHWQMSGAELCLDRLTFLIHTRPKSRISITFDASEALLAEMARVLRLIFPGIRVVQEHASDLG